MASHCPQKWFDYDFPQLSIVKELLINNVQNSGIILAYYDIKTPLLPSEEGFSYLKEDSGR